MRDCQVLHETADLEKELYSEIKSPEIAEHIATCKLSYTERTGRLLVNERAS